MPQRGYRVNMAEQDKVPNLNPEVMKALKLANSGSHDEALELLKKHLEKDPDNFQILYHMGFISKVKHDLENAEDFYLRALKANAQNAVVLCELGIVYQMKEDYSNAVSVLERSIQIKPDYTAAYNSLGITYRKTDDMEKALESFQRGIAISSQMEKEVLQRSLDYSVLCNNLASMLAELGHIDEAKRMFEESIKFIPTGVQYPPPHIGLKQLESPSA